MNLYIIVEGEETEMLIYPKWISFLAPQMTQIENAFDVTSNNYYIFSGRGIPSIYKICIESWLLGNDTVFKENPQAPEYLKYIQFYNVGKNCPENMGNIDPDRFSRTAHFHIKYLKRMLEERNMRYSKNSTEDVCTKAYLEQLIKRNKNTGHIPSFGSWYEFILNLPK